MDDAVADSVCLIALDGVGRLDILKNSFSKIYAPTKVISEFGKNPSWIEQKEILDRALFAVLATRIDPGEAEAIVLASELSASMVILDDKQARRLAGAMEVPVIGTLGVLLRAKTRGILPEVSPIIDRLRENGLYVTEELIRKVILLAGEV
jgi:predicted nucleic acid-binding protein